MTSPSTFVIVGASLAGAKAAETLRLDGFDGRIILMGEEAERPYERPPLSKGYLQVPTAPAFVHDESFYADHDIELRSSTQVTAIHPDTAQVQTESGARIGYDRLPLSTGARPRRLDVPGSDLAGIHYLRTVEDSDTLHHALGSANRVAVVGAGWIGCEVAASARQLGVEVTLVFPAATPLEAVLGSEVGAVYRDLHPHSSVDGFVGAGTVEGVRTGAGEIIAADLVVVGAGAEPRTELAAAAGLALDNGIAVDAHLRTSAPGLYAAGDVAAAWHPGQLDAAAVEVLAAATHKIGRRGGDLWFGRPTCQVADQLGAAGLTAFIIGWDQRHTTESPPTSPVRHTVRPRVPTEGDAR